MSPPGQDRGCGRVLCPTVRVGQRTWLLPVGLRVCTVAVTSETVLTMLSGRRPRWSEVGFDLRMIRHTHATSLLKGRRQPEDRGGAARAPLGRLHSRHLRVVLGMQREAAKPFGLPRWAASGRAVWSSEAAETTEPQRLVDRTVDRRQRGYELLVHAR